MPNNSKKENSWERQPGESLQAYEAFEVYLKMGDDRSCAKVGKQLGKSDTLMERWCSKWRWRERVRDYDNSLRQAEFEEAQKQVKAMQRRQLQTAMLVQKKAVEALNDLETERLTPKDILQFISIGAELERKTRAETVVEETRENGKEGASSLADAISAAYKKRQEGGE